MRVPEMDLFVEVDVLVEYQILTVNPGCFVLVVKDPQRVVDCPS